MRHTNKQTNSNTEARAFAGRNAQPTRLLWIFVELGLSASHGPGPSHAFSPQNLDLPVLCTTQRSSFPGVSQACALESMTSARKASHHSDPPRRRSCSKTLPDARRSPLLMNSGVLQGRRTRLATSLVHLEPPVSAEFAASRPPHCLCSE